MAMESRPRREPCPNLQMLVRRIVVDDEVGVETDRNGSVDMLQETQELPRRNCMPPSLPFDQVAVALQHPSSCRRRTDGRSSQTREAQIRYINIKNSHNI